MFSFKQFLKESININVYGGWISSKNKQVVYVFSPMEHASVGASILDPKNKIGLNLKSDSIIYTKMAKSGWVRFVSEPTQSIDTFYVDGNSKDIKKLFSIIYQTAVKFTTLVVGTEKDEYSYEMLVGSPGRTEFRKDFGK